MMRARVAGVEVLDEIVRVRAFELRQQLSANQVRAGLHPRRRAPWRRDDAQLRVDGQDLAHGRYHVLQIGGDIEMQQCRIDLAGGKIIQGVVLQREIRGADGQARHVQVEVGRRSKQLAQQRRALPLIQLVLDQPRRRIRQRCPEADDGLIFLGDVDLPRQAQSAISRAQPQLDRGCHRKRRRGHPGRYRGMLAPRRVKGRQCEHGDQGDGCHGHPAGNTFALIHAAHKAHCERSAPPLMKHASGIDTVWRSPFA